MVLIVLLATIAISSLAGSKTWDFESGSVDWKVANGKWAIKGGIYQETSGAEKAMHTIVGDAKWKNYTVETKIRIDDGRWAGLILRAHNEREYYVFYLNVPNNETEFWRHKRVEVSMHVIGYLNSILKPRMSKLKLENGMT